MVKKVDDNYIRFLIIFISAKALRKNEMLIHTHFLGKNSRIEAVI